MPKKDGLLKEALRLHELGFWLVPCNGKDAIITGWHQQRVSEDELRRHLTGTKLNIAIALNQSDFIDVECDTPEAEKNLQDLFGGQITATPTWRSKRGNHRLFRRPPGLPEKAVLKLDGIEYRIGNEKGALSVVPPSVHPEGGAYRWEKGLSIHDVEPAELPSHIADLLRDSPPADTGTGDIPEGNRNSELFNIACQLAGAKISSNHVEASLQAINLSKCKPPLPAAEVTAIAKSAVARKSQTAAEVLLEIATADSELWHTPDETTFATIIRDGHREHWPIRSRAYSQFIGMKFYERKKNAVASTVLQDVVSVLEGRARFAGETHEAWVRVAKYEHSIFIDLADESWRAIEVRADGWTITDSPPVRFKRSKGMLPLPEPKDGGSMSDLWKFGNLSEEARPLLAAALVAAFRPTGPYPVVKFVGEQGAAKTTLLKVCRKLIDPNSCDVRGAPRSERDLMIAASNGWVVAFDNLSHISPEISDALCRLATGGGFAVRAQYTDDEETLFNATRPIFMSGIEDAGVRSDLLDRSLIVELKKIEHRRAENGFWQEFEQARPRILGAILNGVSTALKNLPGVEKREQEWPRMADFCQWAVAAEPATGLKSGTFMRNYAENRGTANQTALESSPVVKVLLDLLKLNSDGFEGTATTLLEKLTLIAGNMSRAKGWPGNPRALSALLTRVAPNLRQCGIEIDQVTEQNQKMWRIGRAKSANSQNTQNSEGVLNGSTFCDVDSSRKARVYSSCPT